MQTADVETLGRQLAPDFTLGHMTGDRQSRASWLDDIAQGRTTYHDVTTDHLVIDPEPDGAQNATVRARTIVDVTIGGERGTWRTEFTVRMVVADGRWVVETIDGGTW